MAKTLSKRYSGVLAHPTSFPSPYGIGDFGKGAYDFINFLTGAGQSLWQILPLGHTGYGDSPYQAFSAFAGQPLLISPDELIKDGLLYGDDLRNYPHFNPDHIYYGDVIPAKLRILHRSYEIFKESADLCMLKEFDVFCEHEKDWLDDYALFMAGKDAHGGACWLEWEDDLRDPDEEIKAAWCERLADSIEYYKYIQFIFFRQWNAIRDYAHVNGIKIVGDIPIFVALDSADVWANRELFQLEKDGYPTVVAGVPPDYFSATGQLWGNPLYDWDYHKKTHYDWWMRRIKGQLNMVDYIRVDHFRGFEQYYAIPYGEETAMHGKWKKGPNEDLFLRMQEVFGKDLPIWAEDLGIITPRVEKLRDYFNLPGMKVLQFAFGDPKDNDILPHRFTTENCICYTGTHDNDTTMGWYQTLKPALQDRVRRYLNTDGNIIHYDMIRAAMGSIARYAIYPIQDLLGFGSDCRMNTPSVAGGNWAFRFRKDHLTPELAANLRKMTELFGRCEPLEPIEEEEGPEGSIKPGETAPGLAPEE
ncbi:MAG: 4-alpha-glucanotransferase [Clostridiales bacterium 41_21_two_genomes]|nr:MAG: 4-alpha-glucanotransferase [Clostridiales bacterium 41_21_two_genomes]